jgi:hypothetical protein
MLLPEPKLSRRFNVDGMWDPAWFDISVGLFVRKNKTTIH